MSKMKITDENLNHNNFTILQNILSHIDLTAFERSLYWALREAAGERSSCTKSYATLAKISGMSEKSVKRTLITLSAKNNHLKKPLIKIKNRITEHGDRDTNEITLTNLWGDNVEYFKEIIGEVTQTPPQVTQDPGVGSHRPEGGVTQTYKQEPFNKNPLNKKQQQPAAPVVVFSCLENLKDPSIIQKEKERISSKYTEDIVIKAVNAVTKRGFMPTDTLLKALNAALKYSWKHEVVDNKDFKCNKELAKKLENIDHGYKFECLRDRLLIIKGVTGIQEEIFYQKSHENFCRELEKLGKINLKKDL